MWPCHYAAAFIVLLLTCASARAAEPFHYPEARHGKGAIRYVNDLPILFVQGTPEEIGEQVAVLGVHPAQRLLDYPSAILRKHGLELLWQPLLRVGESMLPYFPLDHRRELDAMVRAGVDPEAVLAGNTFFDIKRLVACSAVIVEPERSATRSLLMGRNLDFESLGYLHEYSLVTVYRPTDKHAFVSIGFPGMVGCLSGMNDAGLCVAVLEVFLAGDLSKRFDPEGTPFACCIRRLLEECMTVDEARRLLQSMKRGCRMNLALCDKTGGAVFEVTPDRIISRRSRTGVTPCTNHFVSCELAPPIQINFWNTLGRYEKLEEIASSPRLDLTDVATAMRTVGFDRYTLHTMVFEPGEMRLHLAIGSCPSSSLPLKQLDAGVLLRAPRGD